MIAAGLTNTLFAMSTVVDQAFFQKLVTEGGISQDELDGTRKNLSAVIATLKQMPEGKIEAIVAKHNDELTYCFEKFNFKPGDDPITCVRNAQVMTGYVTTVMVKSGIRE